MTLQASPVCTVNSTATTSAVSCPASSAATVNLASVAGVTTWSLTCIGTDETSSVSTVNAAISINSTTQTATISSSVFAAGTAFLFQSVVNNNLDQYGNFNPQACTTTFKLFCNTNAGLEVLALGETTQANASFGWIPTLNALIRPGYFSAYVAGTGLSLSGNTFAVVATAADTPSNIAARDSSGQCAFTTVTVPTVTAGGTSNLNLNTVAQSTSATGTVTVTSGAATGYSSGNVTVTSGAASGSSNASGNLYLETGAATSSATQGKILVSGLNINASALLATDSAGGLTSTTSGISPSFTGVTVSGNVTTGTATIIAPSAVSSGTGSAVSVVGGASSTTGGTAGAVSITGGAETGTGSISGGQVNVTGGSGSASTTGLGGGVVIDGGASGSAVANSSLGGSVNIYGGAGGSSGYRANIFLGPYTSPGSTPGNSVIYIGNAQVAPAGTPSGGGCLYASGGDLYWLSSNGTAYKIAGP